MKQKRPLLLMLIVLTGLHSGSFAQGESVNSSFKMPAHPRLLLYAGEEAEVKKNIGASASITGLHQAILNESDRLITLPPVERIKIGRRLLDKSREALRRLFFLSYAYRFSGKKEYADRAEKEMLAIAAFSDWNPTHFLDVAEMTTAMSIGYDWLYNYLSPASRSAIKDAILKKGLYPSLDTTYNGNWLHAEHNWNQVCHTGMAYGAMAIYEDQPELAREIINRSIACIPSSMHDYGPDGIYPEGYSYWGYGTSFNVLLIGALDKIFGQDFGLSAKPGFLKTGGFEENMTGPTGRAFNYSDAGEEGGMQPPMFWFATRTDNPSLLWAESRRLIKQDPRDFTPVRLLPAVILWNRSLKPENAQPPASGFWVGQGKNPIAMMRSSWTDTNAIYVAMKGGSGNINHAHMDVGSFVMDADGERWAMDFGRQEYESLESKGLSIFGRSQNAQRWTVFRYINQVHNTLTVNDQHQWIAGFAPIIAASAQESFMHATMDLTEAYKGQLSKARRGIALVDKKYVVVRDELATGDTAAIVRWTLLTPASVEITGSNSATLTQHGKKMYLQVDAPGTTVTMKTWPTDPPPHDYDAPNPGTIRTGFEISLPAHTSVAVTVRMVPEKAKSASGGNIPALDAWKNDQIKN